MKLSPKNRLEIDILLTTIIVYFGTISTLVLLYWTATWILGLGVLGQQILGVLGTILMVLIERIVRDYKTEQVK